MEKTWKVTFIVLNDECHLRYCHEDEYYCEENYVTCSLENCPHKDSEAEDE